MEEVSVIQLADAGSQPHAMVVEAHNAIVAVVAVRGSQWPENVAALTKFHFVDTSISAYRRICLCLKIKNLLLIIL